MTTLLCVLKGLGAFLYILTLLLVPGSLFVWGLLKLMGWLRRRGIDGERLVFLGASTFFGLVGLYLVGGTISALGEEICRVGWRATLPLL